MNATTKSKVAKFANLKPNLVHRARLEKSFMDCQAQAGDAEHNLRVNRVHAGQVLLELKTQFAHGDWLPYLADLCGRAKIPTRTARQYMKDATVASKIPQALLDEAKRQGFDTTARHIREDLAAYILEHPNDDRAPQIIVRAALGTFIPPLTAEQRAARDAAQEEHARKWHEAMNEPDPEDDAYQARLAAKAAYLKEQESLALEVITAGYRALSKKFHPDAGGTPEQFRLLTDATKLLRERLKQEPSSAKF